MRTHADHRIQEEMNEVARLDRLRHILEVLDDCPHFDFYAHEHPEEAGQQFSETTAPHPSEGLSPQGAPKVVEPGHIVCDGHMFRYGNRVLGVKQTHTERLSKLGTAGPIKIKLSKDGSLAMDLLPGLTLKGLTSEVCAADLVEIGTQRPDVPVEVSTPEVANMLQSAQVVVPV